MSRFIRAKLLQDDPRTRENVLVTKWLTPVTLREMIRAYPFVCLKPDKRGKKRTEMRINVIQPGEYLLHRRKEYVPFINKEELVAGLYRYMGKAYIIQQEIHSVTLQKRPFSVRVRPVQLNGKWLAGNMNGSLFSIKGNHRTKSIPMEKLIQHLGNKRKETIFRLEEKATQVAEVISGKYPCLTMGIDLGIDRKGKIWILDVLPGAKSRVRNAFWSGTRGGSDTNTIL